MRYRNLGTTGVQVSELGLGGNQFGTTCDQHQTAEIVYRALDLGVNFIDTADAYGEGASEEAIGKAVASRRNDVVLCTKTGAGTEPGRLSRLRIAERLNGSLRRLGMDHVDVYYLHLPDRATPLEETLDALDDLVRAGKIRYVALSNHPAWQVAEAVTVTRARGWSSPVASQMRYNLIERAVENEMIPACLHLGISLVPYIPLAGGFLTGKYKFGAPPPATMRIGRVPGGDAVLTAKNFQRLEQFRNFAASHGHNVGELAIAWLLAKPVVCSVIAGATHPDQVAANAKAIEWDLRAEDLSVLDS